MQTAHSTNGKDLSMSEAPRFSAHAYSDWFSLKIKRQRLNYFIANLLLGLVSFAIVMVMVIIFREPNIFLLVAFSLLWWVVQIFLASQRLRDIQIPQWWLVAIVASQILYFLIPYGAVLPITAVSFLTFWPGEDNVSATGKYVTTIPVVLALLFLTLYKTPLEKCVKRLGESGTVYFDPEYVCMQEMKEQEKPET
jgi:uncharacterized membrane protein YhaH (DUF805 family)